MSLRLLWEICSNLGDLSGFCPNDILMLAQVLTGVGYKIIFLLMLILL